LGGKRGENGNYHQSEGRLFVDLQRRNAVVDAFPLDAVERKLLFGARKGVTLTVVTWFPAHLENNLGMPPAK
jgi:hypothetical protein